MDYLDDLVIFLDVVRRGSFNKAAGSLDLPRSTVSRRIAQLERKLGVQLLNRSTRQIQVTEIGRRLYEIGRRPVDNLHREIRACLEEAGELTGRLSVTMPIRGGLDFMGAWLLELAAAHPDLKLELRLNNRMENLLAKDIDLAFRVGPLPDTTAMARKLWDIPYVLVARPDVLADRGIDPKKGAPGDLEKLPAILVHPMTKWTFINQGRVVEIKPQAVVEVDDFKLALEAARLGLGLTCVPELLFRMHRTGDLLQLHRPDYRPQTRAMYAYHHHSKQAPAKVEAAITYVLRKYRTTYGATTADFPA